METIEKPISGDDSARPWQSYNTVYTNAKAGMEGVDKEKVQRVVYEMSKGSKYFENEERKEVFMKQKIENMRAQYAKLTAADITHNQKIADKRIFDLEATRDLSRIWLHVDMDAFYAAVETLCNPSLEGKPMAVGGLSMISTANYVVGIANSEFNDLAISRINFVVLLFGCLLPLMMCCAYFQARKFGVRAAMPGFIARKLCPQLIFVPTDFKKYNYYSDLTRKVYQKYDPNFLAASLDEAYLDITNFCSERGMTGGEVAEELRESVHKETGLTCSAGVAPNRLLAKVCSDINKPNGQFVLPNERMAVMTFISSLPIRKIGGIGRVTENVLKDVFGITTCQDVLQKSSVICALFSQTSADFFLSVGLGIGRTDAPQVTLRKSMSCERTFSSTQDEASLYQKLADIAENLSTDLKKEDLCGRTLTLKLKTSCFEVRTRAVTLSNYICSSEDILKHGMKLLKAELPVSLRLMGRTTKYDLFILFQKLPYHAGTVIQVPLTFNELVPLLSGDQAFLGSNIDDDTVSIDTDTDTSFSADTYETYKSIDLVDSHQIPDPDNIDFRHDNNEAQTRGNFDIQIDNSKDNVVRGSSTLQTEERQENFDSIFWLGDYQCSVCGAELPPSFVEERQEHFDFHLAERLQEEEESSNVQRTLSPRQQRFVQKDQTSHNQQRKKLKPSPSKVKHIPIDMFFARTGITAQSLQSQKELGRAEGVIRYWFGGKILHLDSIRLQKETLGIEKSIFGIGLFIGAVAIRHGYEQRCRRAELLAINDTHLYHSKLVRFYTRIGFRAVYEVTGSSLGDFSHMLMWGGVGTRMDADLEHLMVKWCSRFKPT
ncbi:hypothetical protein RD792_016175 [Penstemon davidsonii]|uniref:DNA polymerase kappa n=1 Tax=Penstemon davidsonii TaxID=160366 RepID=A0ABR0CJ87_9LAMI|nr:hypothetical protein RD792_016175 [Penstemon davidsonii]